MSPAMAAPPRFSVIVPTCDRNALLTKCLSRLAPEIQSLPAEEYEVVVTDDGRGVTAESLVAEQHPWARWVAGPRKGPAANRNNGARHAAGEWLAFIDDDCIPDARWLRAYKAALSAHPAASVLEGRTYVDQPRATLADVSPVNETGGHLWSCNFAVRADTFNLLGGFDERFPYAAMEDVDLCLRLTRAGHSFPFVRGAAVCHPWRARGGWAKLKQHQESTFIYLAIHPDERRRINPRYYMRMVLRGLLKTTIPYALRLKGRGLKEEALQHISFLQMALYLSGVGRGNRPRGRGRGGALQ